MYFRAHRICACLCSPSWYAEYEAFGDTSYEESLATGASTNQTFTSYTRDIEIGLHYAMARYYHAELGRFITEDPAKDGRNWYVYCANNPLKYVDPSGLGLIDALKEIGNKIVSFFSANGDTNSSKSEGQNSSNGNTSTVPELEQRKEPL